MVTVKVRLQTTGEPVTRILVSLAFDADRSTTKPVLSDPRLAGILRTKGEH